MIKRHFSMAALLSALLLLFHGGAVRAQTNLAPENADQHRSLTPVYPPDRACSPLTSLFSSWDDIDGSKRDEPHTGVDGGRFGDPILAPAPGEVIAVWRADWGWGPEGALMLRHSRQDLGLTSGPDFYYSEFDHLHYDEISHVRVGKKVKRGEVLAHVYWPGGDPHYLPEVHWEVWSIGDDDETDWDEDKNGAKHWTNETGHLIDPLSMMSLDAGAHSEGRVTITPFDAKRDYSGFRGFTYILPCPPLKARAQKR
jgi:murein DD-endopeptidase MepM/ murein hydrolase activator NlpD